MKKIITTSTKRTTYKHRRRIRPCIIVAAIAFAMIALICCLVSILTAEAASTAPVQEPSQTATTTEPAEHKKTVTPSEPLAFFALTSEQRTLIEEVVSAESRGEHYDGQVAVAQCILNACMMDGITPEQAIVKYKYTTNRAKPTASVKEAVAAVFDRGESITEEPILYFYNPDIVDSEFHESQIFITEISNHRFFKEAD